jgi:hypothetical protein
MKVAILKTPRITDVYPFFLIRRLLVRSQSRPPSLLKSTQAIAQAELSSDATVASIGSIFLLLAAIALFFSIALAGELPNARHDVARSSHASP